MDYVEVDRPRVAGGGAAGVAEDPATTWTPERLRGEIVKLREDMHHAAGELRFEEAAKARDRLRELEALELAR